MPEAVIVSTARTPIGRAVKGSLKDSRPDELLAFAINEALLKVPNLDRSDVGDVLVGCGKPSGESGFNIARIVNVLNNMDTVPGTSINRYCASSVQTTRMAFHAIKAGEGDIFISSGVETISRLSLSNPDTPEFINPRFTSYTNTPADISGESRSWTDPRIVGELPNPHLSMGMTAENVAALSGISRKEQDEFALRSQHLTDEARMAGFWDREISPFQNKAGEVIAQDDSPRQGVTMESLEKLDPVFLSNGTVTAGNCCPMNDGAAAVIIMSDEEAKRRDLKPLARIVSTGVSALSPEIMGLGPVEASRRALEYAGMSINDIDLVEINEAFAAQVIPCYRELNIDLDKVNVNGGAIALGHPYGMTGARLQGTMINSFDWHDKTTGLITMCVAGGQGMALILERL